MRSPSSESSWRLPTLALPDHADEFLASITAERGLSVNTAAAYRRDLMQYRATLDRLGGSVSERSVSEHLDTLRSRDLAPSSIARKFASVRAYHRFLVAEGYASNDPTTGIGAPKRPTALPKALTVDEVEAVLGAIPLDDSVGRRDLAIIEFLYATGCRVTELIDVDQHDLDIDTRTVLLTGKGNKQRIVPVGTHAMRAIAAWLPDRMVIRRSTGDSGALFISTRGNRLSRQSVWRIVKRHASRAGIDPDRLSPHVFRHSAATHMVEGGADLRTVQQMLGHASLTTTQVYTRVSPEHLHEVIVVSHPRGR